MMYDQVLIFNTKHDIYFHLSYSLGSNEYHLDKLLWQNDQFIAKLRKKYFPGSKKIDIQ